MLIELKDIKGGVLEQEYSCAVQDFTELEELSREGGFEFHEPLNFKLRLQRTGQLVELDGLCQARVTLSCGRCLDPYVAEIDERFALTFAPLEKDEETEEEVELESEELGLIGYRDETLELASVLQEQLLMAVPISPLCGEQCRGLCPECGVNRNKTRCACEKKPFNNKFSALAGMQFEE